MSQDIVFNREAALKAGYELVTYWDDLEDREAELFRYSLNGDHVNQANHGVEGDICIQYLRTYGRGEELVRQLKRRGIESEVF